MARNVSGKNIFVRDLNAGQQIQELFLVAEAKLGQSRNGPYWSLTLSDRSGQVEAKIWSPLSQEFSEIPAGRFVRVRGAVTSFRDRPQVVVERLELLPEAENGVTLSDFLPASVRPPEEMLEEIEDLCTEHLEHKPWKNFARKVLRDEEIRSRLLAGTGAKTVHHAYMGGLLEHTLAVLRLCLAHCDLYPQLDRQILVVAAVFHDLGKAWELSGGLTNDYTDQGRLLGHIWIGLEKLEPFLAKAKDLDEQLILHLKHIILSHHGEYEFGSPRRPKTPEAFVLHYADNLDAKLNTIAAAFEDLDPTGSPWTGFQRYLDRYLYRPTPTPDDRNHGQKAPSAQFLLPIKG